MIGSFVVLVVIAVVLLSQCGQGKTANRDEEYVLNFDSAVYVCPDDASQSFVNTSGVHVQRHNETTAFMSGVVIFHKGLNNATMLEFFVEKEVSGRYEIILSHEICDICQEIDNSESKYYDYLKYFGFPKKCPFEPNEYRIHDFVADTKDLPINSANAGRYQITMNFYNNPDSSCKNEKIFIGCLKLDMVVEPL